MILGFDGRCDWLVFFLAPQVAGLERLKLFRGGGVAKTVQFLPQAS